MRLPLPRQGDGTPSGSLWAVAEKMGVHPRVVGKEAADAAAAEAAAPTLPAGAPTPSISINLRSHVEAAQADEDCAAEREELRAALSQDAIFQEFAEMCDENTLRRYLSARDNSVEKARLLLLEALQWRKVNLKSIPDYFEYNAMAELGALRVTGLDRFGRAVVVLDAGALSRVEGPAQLRFIAFTLEHAIRRMEGSFAEKFVIFLQLSRFRMSTSPPRAFLRDACKMLSICFPERCGNMIFHQAPRLFSAVFKLCSPFIDPRTAAKFIFVVGDDSPGSANDATLHTVMGARWRSLARLAPEPGKATQSSGSDWADMLSFECAWQLRDQQGDARWGRSDGAGAPSEASTAPPASRLSDLSSFGFVDGGDEDNAFPDPQRPALDAVAASGRLATTGASPNAVEALLVAALEAARTSALAASQAAQAAEKAAAAAQTASAAQMHVLQNHPNLVMVHDEQKGILRRIVATRVEAWKVFLAALIGFGLQQRAHIVDRSVSSSSWQATCLVLISFCAGWALSLVCSHKWDATTRR
eukprot:CAMPEP_0178406032 /NCGR_PEP_ID=MMETSP0689_2-20121128/18704_1 /TAXON_ID=160604 /ORGANISM="Amphidinium massartii, Strain CS-259" /LENGTH=529 /DNA_ID=CAMNT_0020027063 /DNA_START=8 /DNA_END=1597 /DNA_ORIENTATION=+